MRHPRPFAATRKLAVTFALLLAACGEDDPAGTPDAGPPSPTPDAALPGSCDELLAAIEGWVAAHSACGAGGTCEYLGPPTVPSNGPQALCGFAAVPGDDQGALEALTAAWEAAGCGEPAFSCMGNPGTPICSDEGTCVLVDNYDECLACFDLPESPVCTVDGGVAYNACAAQLCLESAVAAAGDCGDSAACQQLDGECTYAMLDEWPCPDGQRFDNDDWERGCAGGTYNVACCYPFGGACTFHGGASMALALDPFTCEPGTSACIMGAQEDGCTYAAEIGAAMGQDPWDADVTVTSLAGGMVQISGTHHGTGRTFTCEGRSIFLMSDEPAVWTCQACDASSNCSPCSIEHAGLCEVGM